MTEDSRAAREALVQGVCDWSTLPTILYVSNDYIAALDSDQWDPEFSLRSERERAIALALARLVVKRLEALSDGKS